MKLYLMWYKNPIFKYFVVAILMVFIQIPLGCAQSQEDLLFYPGNSSIKKNKKVVLISGDEEYRSEESLPMLAKILSQKHGFDAVVLFSIDPQTKMVNPEYQNNIPGLQHLNDADLMIIATRFRALPDEQMKLIDAYLKAGKPVIGLRTSTHAFHFPENSKSAYKHYDFANTGGAWDGGFGKLVLGETWINHHGEHGKEGARAFINGLIKNDNPPILNAINDIWVPTDVYGIKNKLNDATILLFGQPTLGMDNKSPINVEKTIMPLAWIKDYQIPNGKKGKAFATTMGASIDLVNEDLRRLIINASYWAVGLESQITEKLDVEIIGVFQPTMFGFGTHKKGTFPKDYK